MKLSHLLAALDEAARASDGSGGSGPALTIVNDHQPKPLFFELKAEREESFDDENYRACEAADRVWVAVLPRKS